MKTVRHLLIIHAVLLVLASTKFSIISWLWGDTDWTWNYVQYSYENGWGYTYASAYTLWQVLCYLAAYGFGIAVFRIAWTQHRLRLSAMGCMLSVLGALSFLIELTHWIWEHHLSWIASFPAVMIAVWIAFWIQLSKSAAPGTLAQETV